MRVIDVISAPWAITPEMFSEVHSIYARHLRGEKLNVEAIEAKVGGPLANTGRELEITEGGVAVICLEGVLAKKMNLFMRISGGTSMQVVGSQIRQAVADPNVTAIVLCIDSPGGTVDGTQQLADIVYASREKKPIVAIADGTICSAAYWIGSAASKVYIASETTDVGSIGVVATHTDYSRYDKNAGIDSIEITAGKYKRMETESGSLTREGRAEMQAVVNQIYALFVGQVARNRGTTEDDVQQRMADGRIFIGKKAIDAGLVDGVSTLDDVIAMAAAMAAETPRTELDGVSTTVATTEVIIMTPEQLKKDHPATASALVEEGRVAGRTEGEATGRCAGRAEGATAERERISSVLSQRMAGHDELVTRLAFDGKTTGPEAAVQVLAAEKARGTQHHNNLASDAAAANVRATTDAPLPAPKKDIDAVATAAKAREYIEAEAKKGNTVSEIDAIDHVLAVA